MKFTDEIFKRVSIRLVAGVDMLIVCDFNAFFKNPDEDI